MQPKHSIWLLFLVLILFVAESCRTKGDSDDFLVKITAKGELVLGKRTTAHRVGDSLVINHPNFLKPATFSCSCETGDGSCALTDDGTYRRCVNSQCGSCWGKFSFGGPIN